MFSVALIILKQVWVNKSCIIRKRVLQRSFWYILYLLILARKWGKKEKNSKLKNFVTISSYQKFNFNNKSH